MIPLLVGNLASDALSALGSSTSSPASTQNGLFDQLVAKLQAGGAEKTVVKSDGSSVTTLATATGQQVVSETSASGQSLTEAGHVSPVLLHNFLNNLFTTLNSDGAPATGGAANSSAVDQAVNKLDSQLTGGAGSTQGLVTSFSNLMQNAGIGLPSGSSASTALKSFLANAVPKIEAGEVTRSGIRVSA